MTKFARKCTLTNQGMNEGWVVNDGEKYIANEKNAIDICLGAGYSSIEEAYEDEFIYFTEWEDEDEYQYEWVDGKLIEIEE